MKNVDFTNIATAYVLGKQIAKGNKAVGDVSREQSRLRKELAASRTKIEKLERIAIEKTRQEDEQNYLKHELFEISQEAHAISPESDLFRTAFQLSSLNNRFAKIDSKWLSSISDKQFYSETKKVLSSNLSRVVSHWGESVVSDAFMLVTKISSLVALLAELQEQMNSSTASAGRCLLPLLSRLEDGIRNVKSTLLRIPGCDLESFLFADIVVSAEDALRELRNNIFRFKCLILIAKSDSLSEGERSFLYQVGQRTWLSHTEIGELVTSLTRVSPKEFQGTPAQAEAVIEGACRCAQVDGVISEQESKMLQRLADILNVPRDRVDYFLWSERKQTGLSYFDPDSARDFVNSRARLPKRTFRGDALEARKARQSLCIPDSEEVLLYFQFRMLGQLVDCAAMTTAKIYGMHSGRLGENAVSILDVREFEAGIATSRLHLKSGDQVHFHAMAGAFLQFCLECIRASTSEA
ncbi:MAG: TerB family tellurite resistance protein [Pirellulales bacterium]